MDNEPTKEELSKAEELVTRYSLGDEQNEGAIQAIARALMESRIKALQGYEKGLRDGIGQYVTNLKTSAYQHADPEKFVKEQIFGY